MYEYPFMQWKKFYLTDACKETEKRKKSGSFLLLICNHCLPRNYYVCFFYIQLFTRFEYERESCWGLPLYGSKIFNSAMLATTMTVLSTIPEYSCQFLQSAISVSVCQLSLMYVS